MTGAINFAMTDIYGGYAGTTETTVPEDNDQNVLVDEAKQNYDVTKQKSKPIYLGIILLIVAVLIVGAVK